MALFSLRLISREPELTSLELFELGAQGIEERAHPAGAELVLYSEQADELQRLAEQVEGSRIVRYRVVPEQDGWETAWAKDLETIALCKGFWVKPTTSRGHAPASGQLIHIEPDLAFGIGSHPTTQLAARALTAHARGARRVLDVGTGTGVLALLARLLGAERVLGLEIDARALRSAQKNLALNLNCQPVEFSATPLAEIEEGGWDVVIANIEAPVLLDLAADLMRVSRGASAVILTGILTDRLSEVLRRYEQLGARPSEIRDLDDWRLVVLK